MLGLAIADKPPIQRRPARQVPEPSLNPIAPAAAQPGTGIGRAEPLPATAGFADHVASAELSVGEKLLQKDLTRKVEQTMWLGIISFATMLLFAVPAFADSCLFSAAPPFQLSSDAVEWTMQIASGTTCTRGLKLGSTNIKDVKLIAPPQSGKVDIQGPSFSYTAKAEFQGQDEFTVQVSGTVVRIAGVSDVKVRVSVVDK